MAKTGRGPAFTPEEDLQIVYLKAIGHSYQDITDRLMTGRSRRAIENRSRRLERSGEAEIIRHVLRGRIHQPRPDQTLLERLTTTVGA